MLTPNLGVIALRSDTYCAHERIPFKPWIVGSEDLSESFGHLADFHGSKERSIIAIPYDLEGICDSLIVATLKLARHYCAFPFIRPKSCLASNASYA
jgi:hypothetical protein